MGYFIYARKSEEDEGRQVQSIDDQLASAQEVVATKRLQLVDELKESRSARKPGRPVFNEMVRRLEAGEADGIVCWHPDRLARNAVDAGIIIDLLDRGVLKDLKFGSYTFENSPEGKWMLGIVLGQSKYFVDKLSKDVKRGMQSRVDKGHFPGRAPVGYTNNLSAKSIVPDGDRFDLVQRAFHLVLKQTFSITEVLDILNNEWGFRTRVTEKTGGIPLNRSMLYKMLGNPFYAGWIKFDGKLYRGAHQPMLTMAEFEKIGRRLAGEPIYRRHRMDSPAHFQLEETPGLSAIPAPANLRSATWSRPEFDFTGLMRCGRCGCRITAERKVKRYETSGSSRTYVYYHCTNGKKNCDRKSIGQAELEAQIGSMLRDITIEPWAMEWCIKAVQDWRSNARSLEESEKQKLEARRHALEAKKSRLVRDRLEYPDVISMEEFRDLKAEIENETAVVAAEIENLTHRAESAIESAVNVFDFARNAHRAFVTGSPRLRREIASRLTSNYFLTLGKLGFRPNSLLGQILTFEPPKIGSGNKKDSQFEAACLSWYALGDEIRKIAWEQGLKFGAVEWDLYNRPELAPSDPRDAA